MFQTNKRIFFQDEHLPRQFGALSREILSYFHFQSTFWLFAPSRQDSRSQHPRSPNLGQLAHYVSCGTYSSLQLRHTMQKERQGQSLRFSKWRLFPLRKKETQETMLARFVLCAFCTKRIIHQLHSISLLSNITKNQCVPHVTGCLVSQGVL